MLYKIYLDEAEYKTTRQKTVYNTDLIRSEAEETFRLSTVSAMAGGAYTADLWWRCHLADGVYTLLEVKCRHVCSLVDGMHPVGG